MATSFLETLAYPFAAAFRAATSLFSKEKKEESPGEEFFANLLQQFGWFGSGPGGWSQDRVMQVQQFRGWVYCAVRAIAEEVAGQPVQVAYRRDPDRAERDRKAGKGGKYLAKRYREKALSRLQQHEELELVRFDHPARRLLDNPNPPDTYETFWQKLSINLNITGNGYIWVINNQLGYPMELWVLPSHWVWPVRATPEQAAQGQLLGGYEIRPYGVRSTSGMILPPDDVIHIMKPHPSTPYDGFSPLTAGAPWIDTANAQDESRYAGTKQGIWPGLILKLLPDVIDPDEPTLDRLRQRFRQHYQGPTRSGQPLVLSSGMDLLQATRSPAEMDWIQGSEQLRDMVLALFRVSKVIVGITTEVNRATMEAAQAGFAQWTIKPELRLVDGVLTEKLATRFSDDLVIFHHDPTPDDRAQLNLDLDLDMRWGIRTPNEARGVRGLEPYEHGGDDPLLPTTLAVVPFGTGSGGGADMDALDALFANLKPPGAGGNEGSDEGNGEGEDEEDNTDGDGTNNDGATEGDDKTTALLRRRGRGIPTTSGNGNGHAHSHGSEGNGCPR